jgi:hypothetical protein
MPDYEKQHSSGVAKAGLITGITGTVLGALNGAGGLFGGRGGYGSGADVVCRHELKREEKNKQEHNRAHDKLVTKETLALTEKLSEAKAEIERLKAEKFTVATVSEAVAPLQTAISALETKAALQQRDIQDVVTWAKNTFVPQETGYVDGRRINFHGTHPILGVNGGDERFPKNRQCNCNCEFAEG